MFQNLAFFFLISFFSPFIFSFFFIFKSFSFDLPFFSLNYYLFLAYKLVWLSLDDTCYL